jgi:16S rRNA (cytosine1402-N4)-methyltransferase
MIPHQSVLLTEFLSFFETMKIKTFIDGTIGAGGHSLALLEAHPEIELLIGLDQDEEALEIARKRLEKFGGKVELHHTNFRRMKSFAKEGVDGIFLDLGVSSMQLDEGGRGFSFNKEGPLDMRMDPESNKTAAQIVNTYSEKELADLFFYYGEETRSRRAAKAIVEARRKKKFKTTIDLVEVLKPVLTWGGRTRKNIHPLTLVFQALRIEVNDELASIKEGIHDAVSMLNPKGRVGVISFQSLEDRIVKEEFRHLAKEEKGLILTKKPIVPRDEEIASNPRSRSAKLRFLEKL